MNQTIIVTSIKEAEQLKDEWKGITATKENLFHPFVDYDVVFNYAKHFISEQALNFLVFKSEGQGGIIPFYKTGKLYKSCGLIGDAFFDYTDIIGVIEQPSTLCQILGLSGSDVVSFMHLREDSPLFKLLSCFHESDELSNLYRLTIEDSVLAPYIDFKGKTLDDYYKGLSKNVKSDLRRKKNRLADYGKAAFGFYNEFTQIQEMLPQLYEQHMLRRKALGQSRSIFTNPKTTAYFNDLIKKCSASSKVYLFYLKVDDTPIAFVLSFLYGNKLYYYVPTFDIEYSKCSPGILLLSYMIQFCFENKIEELDFMIGQEGYKGKFCNGIRKIHNVLLSKKSLLGCIGYTHFFSRMLYRELRARAVNSPLKPLRRFFNKAW